MVYFEVREPSTQQTIIVGHFVLIASSSLSSCHAVNSGKGIWSLGQLLKGQLQSNIANFLFSNRLCHRPSERLIWSYDSDTGPVCDLSSMLVSMVQG